MLPNRLCPKTVALLGVFPLLVQSVFECVESTILLSLLVQSS